MAKIPFTALDPVPKSVFDAHRKYAHGLGCIDLRSSSAPLAVVGGGPSVAGYVEELQNFDGEIWAINDTIVWCKENGIDARFYAVDPCPNLATFCGGVESAILGDTVHPDIFDALDCDIELANLRGKDGIPATISSAATALFIAARRGHSHITFYGCEGSFTGQSHVYKYARKPGLWVDVGGHEYATTSDLLMSAEFIGNFAKIAPSWITAKDDGFLSAFIEHGDYDVTHISQGILDLLEAAA